MERLLTADEVQAFITEMNGKAFTIEFVKRSTGEVRVMNATTDYAEHLKGGQAAYDFADKALMPVWDLDKQAFRSIPLGAVISVKAGA